jgi:hypothetical protein
MNFAHGFRSRTASLNHANAADQVVALLTAIDFANAPATASTVASLEANCGTFSATNDLGWSASVQFASAPVIFKVAGFAITQFTTAVRHSVFSASLNPFL